MHFKVFCDTRIQRGGLSIDELANELCIDSGAVARTIRLTLLSPKVIHKIISGVVIEEAVSQEFPIFLGRTGKNSLGFTSS